VAFLPRQILISFFILFFISIHFVFCFQNRFDKGPHRSNNVPQAKPASALSSFAYKDNSVKNPAEPDFLSKALSSGRKDKPTDNSNQPQQQKQKGQVVGTLQDLEKPYLRLTTYVKPENVRPMSVLIQSLAHIKSKYFQEEDFEWANEQLKSVRQDITVQRLRNKFVLDVYETHARILLEHGDLPEFNQCQTMIRYLTTSGVEPEDAGLDPMGMAATDTDNDSDRTVEPLVQSEEHSDEFRAYHVIYSLVQNSWEDLSKALIRVREIIRNQDGDGSSFMSSSSSSSSSSLSKSSRHSLQVVKSVIHNDYRAFFRLYEAAPHMSAYLMDFLVKRMREKAYERIIAAYRPTICVEHFRETLCFHDMEETRLFLRQLGAVFVKGEPPIWVDCKASSSKKCIHILSM